ncbi:Bacterial alpha-L-rhamnosidase [compost metagenome]
MDWAGLGRQGQAAALNAQYAGTLNVASQIAQAVGAIRISDRYATRAAEIFQALNQSHWDERRGVWVDMVESQTGDQLLRTSQHTNAAMTLWGNFAEERVGRALTRITDPARQTMTAALPVVPVGSKLDEEEGVVMANTFYGHFVCEALARHGQVEEALSQIRRSFAPMVDAGATTLWEAMSPFASLCHGFSASPTYFLSRHILGVAPVKPGFEEVRVAPDLADLQFAEGLVPAGERDIHVRLDRVDAGFTAVIEGCSQGEIAAAPGWILYQCEAMEGKVHALFVRDASE